MDLDNAAKQAVHALLERLESLLPPGWGVMTWVYSRINADLDVVAFSSHESTGDTLRILAATATKMTRRDSRDGKNSPQRYYDRFPAGAPGAPRAHDQLISSVAVSTVGAHDRVLVWSRGNMVGELVLDAGDGERLAQLLSLHQVQV